MKNIKIKNIIALTLVGISIALMIFAVGFVVASNNAALANTHDDNLSKSNDYTVEGIRQMLGTQSHEYMRVHHEHGGVETVRGPLLR